MPSARPLTSGRRWIAGLRPKTLTRPRIRVMLLVAIAALMATSLGAVATFVLIRNAGMSKTLSALQVQQTLSDVEFRVGRFLEKGPAALIRMRSLANQRLLDLRDLDQLSDYLTAEMRASPELYWLSYSDRATGRFVGVTRRAGKLVLQWADPGVNGGVPREWELRDDGTRAPPTSRMDGPYDPRGRPWFKLGLEAKAPRWTDPYEFAEGEPGVSVVLGLRPSGADAVQGVATADFRLGGIDAFLAGLRVAGSGRAALIAPLSTGGRIVLGGLGLPADMQAALAATADRALATPARAVGPAASGQQNRIGDIIAEVRPLRLENGLRWLLAVMVSASALEAPIRRATLDTIAVSAAFLLTGILVAAWIASAISRPIRSMSGDLLHIGELHISDLASTRSVIREVDFMGGALDRMKAGLRSFAFYVPVEVVRAVLSSGRVAELGGETRDLTVLFSDIANFTRIAETLPPQDVVRDLGDYFDLMERAITGSDGIVDKFMGDGVLAFFNAPVPLPDHPRHASEAALDVQRQLVLFNAARAERRLPPFRTRIGLACGPVVVGNIGTPRRFSYTAIGDTVNLASRLESLNKAYGTAVLAAGEVRNAAGDGFEWRHLDRITVAGRSTPVELFELMGRVGEVDAATLRIRDLHEAALAALLAGDFDEAERQFHRVLEAAPNDRPATVLLSHSMAMRADGARNGGSDAWTGVHVHKSK